MSIDTYYLRIQDTKTGLIVDDEDLLMKYADLNFHCDFEDIGMQGDGTPVVFDKCGNFGYLDDIRFNVIIQFYAN